jgi:hypothetical protein
MSTSGSNDGKKMRPTIRIATVNQSGGTNIGVQNNYGRPQRHLTDADAAFIKANVPPGAPIKFQCPMGYEECIRLMYEIREWALREGYQDGRWEQFGGGPPRPGLALVRPDPLATVPGYSPPIPDGDTWTIYIGPAE